MNYVDFRISLHLERDLQNILMEHVFDREKNQHTNKVRFIEYLYSVLDTKAEFFLLILQFLLWKRYEYN